MKRFALVVALAASIAGVVVMPGSSASFNDSDPCPADGPLLVCPKAHVGQPYSLQLLAKAGCDLYRWEITNGSLPAGLTMSSSGLVTGTPTASGPTQPWVTVHDLLPSEGGYPWCGGDNKSERQFVFTAVPGLSIQNESVPGGTIGQPYSVTFTALSVTNTNPLQGSPASVTWSVQSGNLPAGVTFTPQGVLSGTPTSEGSYQFVVRAVGGVDSSDTETETLVVRQPIAVSSPFTSRAAMRAEVSVPVNVPQTATGGAGTFTWSVSDGALPAGVTLNPDGTLAGTPTVPGRFAWVMSVKDQEDRTTKVNATLVVSPKLAIRTLRLKAGKVARPYRFKVATFGGVAPTTWTVTGKLPKGVSFGPRIGTFLGIPRKAGKYRLTLEATDSLDVTAARTLTLVVVK
jgi:large repetitive protein